MFCYGSIPGSSHQKIRTEEMAVTEDYQIKQATITSKLKYAARMKGRKILANPKTRNLAIGVIVLGTIVLITALLFHFKVIHLSTGGGFYGSNGYLPTIVSSSMIAGGILTLLIRHRVRNLPDEGEINFDEIQSENDLMGLFASEDSYYPAVKSGDGDIVHGGDSHYNIGGQVVSVQWGEIAGIRSVG